MWEPSSETVDIDECAAKMHYCHANTVCVNLPGLYRCDCVPGYIRVDDFSCTEHDDCGSGQHNCDENAICTNTVQGHSCTCKPGYVGNGTICRVACSPNECGGNDTSFIVDITTPVFFSSIAFQSTQDTSGSSDYPRFTCRLHAE
ncbi:hypothetical protein MJT46_016361 [Ovis ammon polii x Ovis aries]|nr:hypothetical protein MJT46_016361 [Ovis ammon polii x Ovis aries]